MIMNIYAVRDSAVEAFLQPFFSPTHGAAIRSLTEAVNDKDHQFNKNAKYYSLYYLGAFDDADGVIMHNESKRPDHLIDCIDLLNKI